MPPMLLSRHHEEAEHTPSLYLKEGAQAHTYRLASGRLYLRLPHRSRKAPTPPSSPALGGGSSHASSPLKEGLNPCLLSRLWRGPHPTPPLSPNRGDDPYLLPSSTKELSLRPSIFTKRGPSPRPPSSFRIRQTHVFLPLQETPSIASIWLHGPSLLLLSSYFHASPSAS